MATKRKRVRLKRPPLQVVINPELPPGKLRDMSASSAIAFEEVEEKDEAGLNKRPIKVTLKRKQEMSKDPMLHHKLVKDNVIYRGDD
jgi:hypothetical protein